MKPRVEWLLFIKDFRASQAFLFSTKLSCERLWFSNSFKCGIAESQKFAGKEVPISPTYIYTRYFQEKARVYRKEDFFPTSKTSIDISFSMPILGISQRQ